MIGHDKNSRDETGRLLRSGGDERRASSRQIRVAPVERACSDLSRRDARRQMEVDRTTAVSKNLGANGGEKKKRPPDHFPFRPALRLATTTSTTGVALCVVNGAPTPRTGTPRESLPSRRQRVASFLLLTDSYFDMRDFPRAGHTCVYSIIHTDIRPIAGAHFAYRCGPRGASEN